MRKLNLGCGTTKLKNWINIDAVADCNPDLVHDFFDKLPYKDCSVDEILAKDLLEHFDKYSRFLVVEDWVRVLKIDGIIKFIVPDFRKILLMFLKTDFDNVLDMIFAENMFNSKVYLGHFGNHKWGYTKKNLESFLMIFGLKISNIKTIGNNIECIAQKERHITSKELNSISVYSYANDLGKGKDKLSLPDIKIEINKFRQKV
ncbi:MAG: methyltransferase domain-containing protein [Patescibacteria group bacterium]|nr:methyltransferase domain-containing protein [Patescibacteria group bacterium]